MISVESDQPEKAAGSVCRSADAGDHGIRENLALARLLEEIATLLAHQGASEFRVQAYRNAAQALDGLRLPVRTVLQRDGVEGLVAIPTIGRSIAHRIEQYLCQGEIPLLDRLRGDDRAENMFATLPSVGPELSHRIHQQLHVETLPELMAAYQEGRLAKVPGIGRKRLRSIAESLTARLRAAESKPRPAPVHVTAGESGPSAPISELLDVDAQYRRLAAQGKLPKIAPRRFNPDAVAWLPVLHTHRGNRHYTAVYSNTARAHQLNTTRDWVVIFRDDRHAHGQWTVITSQFGKLRGWRIVRGREQECAAYYIHHH